MHVHTMSLQQPLLFGKYMLFFSENVFFELGTVFCMVMCLFMEARWSCGNQKTSRFANLQFIIASAILIVVVWRWPRRGRQKNNVLADIDSRSCVWCHGFWLPCFEFWPRFALSFLHVRREVSKISCRHTGAFNFGDKLSLKGLPTQCQHPKAINCLKETSNVLSFWRLSGQRPKVRKSASIVPKYPSSLYKISAQLSEKTSLSRSLRKISLTMKISTAPQQERTDRPKVMREYARVARGISKWALRYSECDLMAPKWREGWTSDLRRAMCGNFEERGRRTPPGTSICASLRSRNAHGHVTRDTKANIRRNL